MAIKLIALDMDDTLLDKTNRVSPRTREVIRQAVESGVTVTIATGRMYGSALPFALQLGLDVPLITYNGALIKCSLSGETLLHNPIDEATAKEVLRLFREKGWYIQSYLNDCLYVDTLNEKARYYEKLSGIKAVPVGDQLYTMEGAPTKLLAMAEPGEIRMISETVKADFGDRLYAAVSKPNYLEMVNPAVNKGQALEFLAARLGLERSEVMAVGDSINDLDMLEYAGWGVAMGNAGDTVKAAANAVTCANDADGVAEAIITYVLNIKQ
jgi:Cof subfamily protein (haloacid dehalogenase superfamily)